jgi:hypothetical protein
MKLLNVLLLAAFAGQSLASWGFGKNAYNKWHETELERWLSDHDIDYPKPAERKDLEKLVQDNWQTRIIDAYHNWEAPQLQHYLGDAGKQVDEKKKQDKNWLVQQVKQGWHETEKTAEAAYDSVKDWIFDSWSDSQLKAFLDRHRIRNPTPSTHENLAAEARKNYNNIAEKLGESTAYPGNWLYESWSESDFKAWLDKHGYPAPQPTTRDKLIASVRRNSRLASIKAKNAKKSTSQTISDTVFDTWSESQIKEFLDKYKVKVPQGSTKKELLALARRNKAHLGGEAGYQSATSAYNAATSSVGSAASQATDTANMYGQYAFEKITEQWSDSKLKEYLDSRGVPVPQNSKRDELLAKVRLHKHKAASGYGAWTFDTWTYDELSKWLKNQGEKVSNDAEASREKLAAQAWAYVHAASAKAGSATQTLTESGASAASHASASATDAAGYAASKASGAMGDAASKASSAMGEAASKATDTAGYAANKVGDAASQAGSSAADAGHKVADAAADGSKQAYASLTSALSQATEAAKSSAFETWSDSDLKAYLDSYGIKTYQGSTRNEWIAMARRNAHYFRYGAEDQGVKGYLSSTLGQAKDFIMSILGMGGRTVGKAGEKIHEKAKDAKDEATTRAQKAYAGAKNEL